MKRLLPGRRRNGSYYRPNTRIASAAAAPFDYLIDPVLEVVSAPFTPFWALFFL